MVLDAAREFDASGGVTIGLTAWEFDVAPEVIASAFARAINDGLLSDTGHDDELGERLWRLTAAGRAAGADVHVPLANDGQMIGPLAALARELARAKDAGWPICIAVADVDRSALYDRRDHPVGVDRRLGDLGESWRAGLREVDLLVSVGGDELGLLLTGCSAGQADTVLGRLRRRTSAAITVSIGIAEWDGGEQPEQLIERARKALHSAKRARDRTLAPDNGQLGSPPAPAVGGPPARRSAPWPPDGVPRR